MPLKAEKRSDSPYYQIIGTIPGYGRVRESSGTKSKAEADEIAHQKEKEIREQLKRGSIKTVAHAVIEYLENGGESRYTEKIVLVLGNTPLSEVNQEKIDRAAREAYKAHKRGTGKVRGYKASTIKREFYVPLAAILHYAAEMGWMNYIRIKTPKVERPAPKWADEQWVEKFSKHADNDLMALVTFLIGTGCRISEVLNLEIDDISLKRKEAYVRVSKTGEPRMAHLPDFVIKAIKPYLKAASKSGIKKVFPFKQRFQVNAMLKKTCKAAGIEYLSSHQVGSHTFATNLARFEKMDAKALTATGRWKNPQSTHHYTHYLKTEQSQKADSLAKLFRK